MQAWSYSSIKTFEQCPKKYYHLKVARDVKDEGGEATVYGNLVHKAAEEYITNGIAVPENLSFIVPVLDKLKNIPGDKYCEQKLGVAYDGANYTPTAFLADNVWWRGIADLLIIDKDKAYLVDYKTGKNAKYADTKQLDVLAAAVFTHYPEVTSIKSALIYLVSNDFIKREHTADMTKSYFATFSPSLDRLQTAEQTNVWNAVSGPLCKFCPVTKCVHNKR
jgi:hypothetical protein